jgi:hypothetical protein
MRSRPEAVCARRPSPPAAAADLVERGAAAARAGACPRRSSETLRVVALQQANAKALLQLPDGMTERRWGDAKPLRRCAEAEMVCDSNECGQVGKVAAAHIVSSPVCLHKYKRHRSSPPGGNGRQAMSG